MPEVEIYYSYSAEPIEEPKRKKKLYLEIVLLDSDFH